VILTEGSVSLHHFDPYLQALSKIERGFQHDITDVSEMLARGLVERERLLAFYDAIEPDLYRYPAIAPHVFRQSVEAALKDV